MKKRNLAICIVGMAFCYILTISDVTTYAAENTDDSIQTETNYWNGNESEKTFSENTEKGNYEIRTWDKLHIFGNFI